MAPTTAARARPTTTSQTREEWADEDNSDDDDDSNDDGNYNGAAVPMTPSDAATLVGDEDSAMGYSPTSPSSSVHMHQLSRRNDNEVAAAAQVCAADEILQLSILETNTEILEIVERLGADTHASIGASDDQP